MKRISIVLGCTGLLIFGASQSPLVHKSSVQQNSRQYALHVSADYSCLNAQKGREVLFFEDFESGMPAGWQVIDGNSDGFMWTVGTTDDLFFPPPNYGTAYAYYSDDDAGESAPPGIECLISPAIGCNEVAIVRFSYSWAFTIFDPPIGASYVRFKLGSAWGAWTQLATYYLDGSGVDTFDLTAYLPADSVQVQFTYEDTTGGWGWAFGIDNVLLESPRDHDVGVASINIPSHIPTDTTFSPEAAVMNYGLNSETFSVTCEINPGAYTSTVTVSNLSPDSTEQVIFPSPFAFGGGLYTVTVYTALIGDENPLNDTLIKEIMATDWLIYDDGIMYGWAYWYDQGNGWGVQFPVTSDWWVDSIACYFDAVGGTDATFRIYDGAAIPTNLRWELVNTTIQTGVWNYIEVDTTATWFTVGTNVFLMYFQVQPGPACPALCFDYVADYPQYMWYCINGSYTNGTIWGGDWMMRIHIRDPVGVAEWISLRPEGVITNTSTIVENRITFAFNFIEATGVELAVYDAVGRICATLIDGELPAGDYQETFNLDLPTGIYFYRVKTGPGICATGKFLVVR